MNILLIEPFYSGSHKDFADQLKKHSNHTIKLLTLEGRFWKWRMYGAAVTLAHQFMDSDYKPDLIMVTDMLDLPVFLSLVRTRLPSSTPILCYFHENQMAYPWKEDSKDLAKERDLHYGMMNYHCASAADWNLFNSSYNMNSLYYELDDLLKKMPDHRHSAYLPNLQAKSSVLGLGLELRKRYMNSPPSLTSVTHHPDPSGAPLILWNHRWEHDKNPEAFFDALLAVKKEHIPFRLAVLGEQYKHMPKIMKEVPELFKEELISYGYGSSENYMTILNHTDLLPVTSNHDFFGISVMEAIHCGATPLLPNRLTYPDLYDIEENPELFYDDRGDLVKKISDYLLNYKKQPRDVYHHLTAKYDWSQMVLEYDAFFESIVCGDVGL